ncbi:hypothetical protein RHSIM_Rhsim06G0143000 [Rhododendron simsii]|uniref:non-specific serine/threonine protein kinase n=1 Tax=Rhododendron simsii TaxID=118357 RepID=A0A834GR40_RHOSS|nr:hypothetical protein RHSIM_Rhsim06G0143000 [Rhododendron simsii]
MGGSPTLVLCASLAYFSFLGFVETVGARNGTTPASEVSALNSVFRQWNISADLTQWNISGEPCSGAAVNLTSIEISNGDYNPGIKCQCDGTTCHITDLKVYALSIVGGIPDELWSLTYLTNLNLAQNYLTGPVSSSIANLAQMQYLSLGINALSREIPKELGNLTNLISLSFSSNSFSGPLPSELGNLTKLQQLYFDSSGASGAIPSTYAALQNLQVLWGSDNELTGSIPEFIGNWSQLVDLRFQGNSFEGPIPPSFSNLTKLESLMISDLSNGSTSLEFLKDMTSLITLILRNNKISCPIPSNIGDYQSLSLLFLGNNKLNGTLPALKSVSLLNIDVSYNELSGSLPSWIDEQGLQLNLVANNFTIERANNSFLPSGLSCLQSNFPCFRNSPIYSNFSIKCGGPQITTSDQTVYERDNKTLGPATYYVTRTKRWAVSNAGRFINNNDPFYLDLSPQNFTSTLDKMQSEVFQTARTSPGSLRYYGLGLENGNYTVTLQFTEIAIADSTSWRSLGRRVFDVYIQGNRVLKDFDIKKEANGHSYQAVGKDFTVNVSENYLEIHLFWAGKGTCCIPGQGSYGPSISAISALPEFTPTISNNPPTSKQSKTGLIVGIVVPVGVVSFLSVLALCCFVKRGKRPGWEDDEELQGMDARPYTFSYAELKAATEDFNPANKLGEGGFGPVFKGYCRQTTFRSVPPWKESICCRIATISVVQYRNLVKLYGCRIEVDKRLLVYEYLENKSLDQALFGKTSLYLNWPACFGICLGVARGLAYLHEESRLRIVRRDVKASNILLDFDLNPKISDFGLAKLYDDKKTHISTHVAGTIGYLAPEYAMRGHLTEKADVYGFGVVALEMVSGRPNCDSSLDEEKIYLLEWAWRLHENDHDIELADANLLEFDEEEVKRVMRVALLCTHTSPLLRPSMSRVVAMLLGDTEVSPVTTRPGYLTDWEFDKTTTFMTADTQVKYSQFSSSSATMGADPGHSPINAAHQVEEVIGECSLLVFQERSSD